MNPHVSNRPGRAADIIEEGVFLQLWQEKQARVPGLNGGYGLLDLVLNTRSVECRPPGMTQRARLELIDSWTARDAYVAASVIQWLGSKEGAVFIQEAEDRIAKLKKEASEEFHRVFNLGLPPTSKRSMAEIMGRSI